MGFYHIKNADVTLYPWHGQKIYTIVLCRMMLIKASCETC